MIKIVAENEHELRLQSSLPTDVAEAALGMIVPVKRTASDGWKLVEIPKWGKWEISPHNQGVPCVFEMEEHNEV
jgi:hypothetical protein